jgi:hypothetical protein
MLRLAVLALAVAAAAAQSGDDVAMCGGFVKPAASMLSQPGCVCGRSACCPRAVVVATPSVHDTLTAAGVRCRCRRWLCVQGVERGLLCREGEAAHA